MLLLLFQDIMQLLSEMIYKYKFNVGPIEIDMCATC